MADESRLTKAYYIGGIVAALASAGGLLFEYTHQSQGSGSNNQQITAPGNNNINKNVTNNYALPGSVELRSTNPRKELAAMGVQWSPENFHQAIMSGDLEELKLFAEGGIKYPFHNYIDRIILDKLIFEVKDVDPVLDILGRQDFDNDQFCPMPQILKGEATPAHAAFHTWVTSTYGPWYYGTTVVEYDKIFATKDSSKIAFIKRLCNQPGVVAQIDDLATFLRQQKYQTQEVRDQAGSWRRIRLALTGQAANW